MLRDWPTPACSNARCADILNQVGFDLRSVAGVGNAYVAEVVFTAQIGRRSLGCPRYAGAVANTLVLAHAI